MSQFIEVLWLLDISITKLHGLGVRFYATVERNWRKYLSFQLFVRVVNHKIELQFLDSLQLQKRSGGLYLNIHQCSGKSACRIANGTEKAQAALVYIAPAASRCLLDIQLQLLNICLRRHRLNLRSQRSEACCVGLVHLINCHCLVKIFVFYIKNTVLLV